MGTQYSIITDATREKLCALRQNTEVSPWKLLELSPDISDAPQPQIIQRWLTGKLIRAKPNQVEAVIQAWEALPQREFIVIGEDKRKEIERLIAETGIGAVALLRGQRGKAPEGLTSAMIRKWLEKPSLAVRKDYFEWAVARWNEVLGSSQSLMELTDDRLDLLTAEMERTGVKPVSLLARAIDPPVNAAMVYSWLNKTTRTARVSDFGYVLSLWLSLPDLGEIPAVGHGAAVRIPLTHEIVAELLALQEKSGLGPSSLFKWAATQKIPIPRGVSAQALRACIKSDAKTINSQLYAFALEAWPAACAYRERPVPIEGWMLKSLRKSRDLGILPKMLFGEAVDVPGGLGAGVIDEWLSGTATEAKKNHLDWVLSRCKALSKAQTPRVAITEGIQATLVAHRERSGVEQTALLKGARDIPDGLSAQLITAWIGGYIGTARKDFLDYVIARWMELPDG